MSKKRCEECNTLYASNHTQWGYICNRCQSVHQKKEIKETLYAGVPPVSEMKTATQATNSYYVSGGTNTNTTNGTYGGTGSWVPNTLGTPQDLYIQQQLGGVTESLRHLHDKVQQLAMNYGTMVNYVITMEKAMKEQTEVFKDLMEALE